MGTLGLQERYINFYTDFAFKKLFGTEINKELLISFLNSLFDGQEVIKDLTYLNPEQLGEAYTERKAVFDVYCENENGEKFIVEMQNARQDFFKDRSVYYSTFPIREYAEKGNWNFKLGRIYCVGILNFSFDEDKASTSYRHTVKLAEIETGKVFYDKLTFVYLEMPKFIKEEDELTSLNDRWLYAIKHLSRLFERPRALQEKVFERLFEQAEIAKFTPVERQNYEESLKNLRDWFSVMETAKKQGFENGLVEGLLKGHEEGLVKGREEGLLKGREEGREEGLVKGRSEAVTSVALNLKTMGLPTEQIIKATGLTAEEIESL